MRSIWDFLRSAVVAGLAFAMIFAAFSLMPVGLFRGLPDNLDDSRDRGALGNSGSRIDIRSVERSEPSAVAADESGGAQRLRAPETRAYAMRRLTAPIPAARYASAYRPPRDGTEGREAVVDGRGLAYRAILPRSAYGGQPNPVLVIFADPSDSPVGVMEAWRETAARAGLVLAAPEAGWRVEAVRTVLSGVLEDLDRDISVDRERVYLFGDGRGGAAVLSLERQEEVRAVAAHGRASGSEAGVVANGAAPVVLAAGTAAGPRDISIIDATADALARSGRAVTLLRIDGHTDWFEPIGAWLAGEIWAIFRRS